jgi:hypothetical protein
MITVLFFLFVFGCAGAILLATLGDEIRHFVTHIIDRVHSDNTDKHLRSLHQKATGRKQFS